MISVYKGCAIGNCGKPEGCTCCMYHNEVEMLCDRCKEPADKLYLYEEMEICEECLLEQFQAIVFDEAYRKYKDREEAKQEESWK